MLRLEVPEADGERAADMLWAAGATGVEEADAGRPGWVRLTCDADPDAPALHDTPAHWRVESLVDDGAWWDGWRPFAQAVRVGNVVVRPPWVEPEGDVAPGTVEVVLDAGRSFGTGSHPSTTLVLAELQRLLRSGDAVLDVGCGSGALAVAAVLLGAGRVVAIDPDPEALVATAANAAANGMTVGGTDGSIDLSATPVDRVRGPFDLVLANLGSPLVVELAAAITAAAGDAGSVVLSGMLEERWDHVAAAYPGFVVDAAPADAGWRAVVLRRSPH